MGRRLKAPNELLRASGVGQIGQWADYHRDLVKHMRVATETARRAAAQNQARREKYYNQRTRATTQFKVGDVVWILRPPKGRGVTKLAHRWVGPAKVVEDVGYDNWKLVRHDTGDTFVTHCSFLTSYHCPEGLLDDIARQTVAELDEEDGGGLSEIWEEPVVEHGEAADLQGVTEGELRPEPGQAIRPGLPETVPGAVETTQEDERRSGASPDIRQHIRQVLRRRIAERATSQRRQVTKSSGQSTAPTSSGMPDRRMVDGESGIMAASAEINKNSVAAVGEAENSGGRSPTNRIGATTKRRTRATSGSVRKKARTRQTLSSDANDDVEDEVQSHGQARSDARAARDTRAARRRADRDQQGATSTEETSADADRRLYDAGISSSCERRASAAGAAAGPGNVSDQEGAQQDDSKSPDASYDEEDAVHPVGGRGERDDEVGATVQTLRGRGRPRNQPRPEDPLHIEVHGPIVEWGRRRRRNRAGRYVLEYQAEYRSVENGPVEKRWLSIAEYEALLDGGKLGDELGGDVE
ncbi:hypothetical protein F442_02952 [Phytophthora nicotianae P10297]|uniref:Uncharacterized protein n=1 Tax=Phytophthora nicotianae P10297 TaxID=1317064 RepID=W3A0C7_PHYNI|nr:hypothetical protein F442_02952 [Phytophthora nicotianae P10297]